MSSWPTIWQGGTLADMDGWDGCITSPPSTFKTQKPFTKPPYFSFPTNPPFPTETPTFLVTQLPHFYSAKKKKNSLSFQKQKNFSIFSVFWTPNRIESTQMANSLHTSSTTARLNLRAPSIGPDSGPDPGLRSISFSSQLRSFPLKYVISTIP